MTREIRFQSTKLNQRYVIDKLTSVAMKIPSSINPIFSKVQAQIFNPTRKTTTYTQLICKNITLFGGDRSRKLLEAVAFKWLGLEEWRAKLVV